MALPSYDLDVFRAAFPTWSIFCSDEGVFYATRRGIRLRNEDIHRGLHQTVSADDLETFIAVLLEQCQLTVT